MKLDNLINGEYERLQALCERDTRADRMLDTLYATALTQECQHRHGNPGGYKRPASLAARYFAVKCVTSPLRVDANDVESALRALAGLRSDYVQGAVLAAYLRERGIPYALEAFTADAFNAIDYSTDFAK